MKRLDNLHLTREERNEYFKQYYAEGYSYSEIAKATGFSYDTVRGVLRNEPKPVYAENKSTEKSSLDELHDLLGVSVKEKSYQEVEEELTEKLDEAELEPKDVKWVANNSMVNLVIDGEVYNADSTHPNFKEIISSCLSEDFTAAVDLINTGKTIEKWSFGAFEFTGGQLLFCGEPLHGTLVDKIIKSIKNNDTDVNKYVLFLSDAILNDKNSYNEMWDFMKHNDIEISNTGCIIGYKKVTSVNGKLFDSRTRTIPNDLGTLVQMPRHLVNDDKNQTCSYGLHVGSIDYVKSFSGDTIIKVLVAPHNVVSVPSDYDGQKMRCSEYLVTEILDDDLEPIAGTTECLYVATANRTGLFSFEEVTSEE